MPFLLHPPSFSTLSQASSGIGSTTAAAATAAQTVELAELYLEHLVFVEKSADSNYHDQLALLYFKNVDSLSFDRVDRCVSQNALYFRKVKKMFYKLLCGFILSSCICTRRL